MPSPEARRETTRTLPQRDQVMATLTTLGPSAVDEVVEMPEGSETMRIANAGLNPIMRPQISARLLREARVTNVQIAEDGALSFVLPPNADKEALTTCLDELIDGEHVIERQ